MSPRRSRPESCPGRRIRSLALVALMLTSVTLWPATVSAGPPAAPGFVIIQTDGFSVPALHDALEAGRMPSLSALLRPGSHALGTWEALLPITTPASQSAILHGDSTDVPGFRWWDRDQRQAPGLGRGGALAVTRAGMLRRCCRAGRRPSVAASGSWPFASWMSAKFDLTIDSPAVGMQSTRLLLPTRYRARPDARWRGSRWADSGHRPASGPDSAAAPWHTRAMDLIRRATLRVIGVVFRRSADTPRDRHGRRSAPAPATSGRARQ